MAWWEEPSSLGLLGEVVLRTSQAMLADLQVAANVFAVNHVQTRSCLSTDVPEHLRSTCSHVLGMEIRLLK